MIKSKILSIAVVAALSAVAMSRPSVQIAVDTDTVALSLDVDSLMRQAMIRDSIEAALTDSLYVRAMDLQTFIRDNKTTMGDCDSLFTYVYDGFVTATEVLPRLERHSPRWTSLRAILVDLDNDLEAGAYFYSSINDRSMLNRFARAYIDVQIMDQMSDIRFSHDNEQYALMSYIAASDAYNKGEYDRAIDYFRQYFTTGAQTHREDVYTFMGQACINTRRYDLAISTMAEGMKQYPANTYMPMIGLQACIDGGEADLMQDFLTKALQNSPEDESLLMIQGKLYEDLFEWEHALEVFDHLNILVPNRLDVAKHLGLCYYNLGVEHFNRAVNSDNETAARKDRRKARNYFDAAAIKLEDVVASDPMAVRYLRALGVCYLCLEQKNRFETINRQLTALGEDPLSNAFMPPMMAFNGRTGRNYDFHVGHGRIGGVDEQAPPYSQFGAEYITEALNKWVKKGEFETVADFQKRVNSATIEDEFRRLSLEAQQKYLDTYSGMMHLSDISLNPYDATNETFLIDTSYGPVTINVPLKDKEAEIFKSNWEGMRFRSPKYIIDGDRVVISELTVVAPYGKTYTYSSGRNLTYQQTAVEVDLAAILSGVQTDTSTRNQSVATEGLRITRQSDVDVNIPVNRNKAPNTFALIIANEKYEKAEDVQSALHDGEVFAEYCIKTLGLPESNVTYIPNATYGHMTGAISQLANTVAAVGPQAEIIFYYSGHGMPDESSRDAYLLPTDVMPGVTSASYSLARLYDELESMRAASVVVLMDACFSGTRRDGGALLSARSVALAPKEAAPRGSMYVLTAASGQETALPYVEKNHGLFTYYLLKKLQDTKGNVTLKDLADYVIDNVRRQSNVINRKSQTPTLRTSGNMTKQYLSKKMRP